MRNLVLLIAALIALSFSPIFMRWAHASPEVVGFLRMGTASLLLLPFALRKRHRFRKHNGTWLVAAATCFFLHLWTYKYSALHTQVANLMILFSTAPIWTTMGSTLWLKHKLQKRHLLAAAMATGGVLTLFSEGLSLAGEFFWGNLSALASAFFYSAYMLASFKAREHTENLFFSCILYGLTGLLFLLVVLGQGQNPFPHQTETYWAVAALVIFPTLVGHFVFTYLVKHMNLNFLGTSKLIEPIIASAAASAFFAEPVTNGALAAFVMTLCAMMVLLTSDHARPD